MQKTTTMSYVQSLFHIIICTKYRAMTIDNANKEHLYRYIWGVVSKSKCKLVKINGIENHIHMFIEVHPTVAVADLVRDIKRASSYYAQKSELFPSFVGWSAEYAAFSASYSMKDKIINYIQNQETHHGKETLDSEYQRMATLHGLAYYEPEV